jgi:hyperosmotically inducible periplasmic protein
MEANMKVLVMFTAGIVAATGSMTIVACNRTDATQPPAQTTTTAAVDDDQLETYVRARFQMADDIRAQAIDVSAENGRITLRGRVPSEQARQQAVRAAQGISGVQSVDDQLTVTAADSRPTGQPSPGNQPTETARGAGDRDPAWITTKIRAQYYANPEIRPWNIDVTTNADGAVTLSGTIDDAADRQEAVRIARDTEGVTGVTDRLTADRRDATNMQQPDAWITAKIQAQYFLDAEVKARDINVDTNGGVVTLRGTVDNDAERRQALMIARSTEGVRDVTDQLTVTAAARQTDHRTDVSRAADAVDDAWITTKIQSKFYLDPDIKGSAIDVTTTGGVVTLQGSVPTATQKKSAELIAMETDGVRRVNNQLKVAATTNR